MQYFKQLNKERAIYYGLMEQSILVNAMKPVGLDLDGSLSQQGLLEARTHHYPITLHNTEIISFLFQCASLIHLHHFHRGI